MNWFVICAWLAVIAAGALVSSHGKKTRLFALFAMYLLTGMACLLSGATLLGFALWMVGALLVLSVMVHVPVFGNTDEVGAVAGEAVGQRAALGAQGNFKRLSPLFFTALVTIGAGLFGLSGSGSPAVDRQPSPAGGQSGGIREFSEQMVSRDWLKLELAGILLLVSVVGAGVTTRAERLANDSGKGGESA